MVKSLPHSYYKIDVDPSRDKGPLCRVLAQPTDTSLPYIVSAELMNQAGWKGLNSGHLGLLFNAKDENNFDFIYFRPHHPPGCYQTGYLTNGKASYVQSASCPNGPPKGGVWFPVSLFVHGQYVQVFLNGSLVATVRSHFPPRASGGVFGHNGYINKILFRKFQIAPQNRFSKRCADVVEFPDFVKLDAGLGTWPNDGFCQIAFLKDAGQSTNYQLTVKLYNFMGRDQQNFGHPGVLFNTEDQDNYDFVYFRPHSTSGCFQTGYVYKGKPKFDQSKSGTCPSGPPKGAEWFIVKVTVSTATPAGEAKVYLNGNLVVSWNPRYPVKNRGGVLVANGYKNVVYYKDFQIY